MTMNVDAITGEISARMLRYKVASFGFFVSAVFSLIVATFPAFFIFDPAHISNSLRLIILLFSTLAWVALAIGPVIVFTFIGMGKRRAVHALPFIGLFWPVMIVINHLELWISTGDAYMSYLIQFPVFVITDILIPVFLVGFWLEYRFENHQLHAQLSRPAKHLG